MRRPGSGGWDQKCYLSTTKNQLLFPSGALRPQRASLDTQTTETIPLRVPLCAAVSLWVFRDPKVPRGPVFWRKVHLYWGRYVFLDFHFLILGAEFICRTEHVLLPTKRILLDLTMGQSRQTGRVKYSTPATKKKTQILQPDGISIKTHFEKEPKT